MVIMTGAVVVAILSLVGILLGNKLVIAVAFVGIFYVTAQVTSIPVYMWLILIGIMYLYLFKWK